MNKRGSSLLQDSLPELILAAVGILIISFLLIALIGNWDKKDLNEKGIFNSLKKSLDLAQKEGSSDNFLIYLPFAPVRYFLVYFDKVGYPAVDSFDSYKFFYKGGIPKHALCICSADVSDENPVLCQKKYCINLPDSISSLTIQNENMRTKDFFAIPLDLGMNMNINYDKYTKEYSLNIVSKGYSKSEDYSKTKIRENACSSLVVTLYKDINPESHSMAISNTKKTCLEMGSFSYKLSKGKVEIGGGDYIEKLEAFLFDSENPCLIENIKEWCACGIDKSSDCTNAIRICNLNAHNNRESIAIAILNAYRHGTDACGNTGEMKLGIEKYIDRTLNLNHNVYS